MPVTVTPGSCDAEAPSCEEIDTRIVVRSGIYMEDEVLQPSLEGIAEMVATNTLSLTQDMACGAFIGVGMPAMVMEVESPVVAQMSTSKVKLEQKKDCTDSVVSGRDSATLKRVQWLHKLLLRPTLLYDIQC